MNLCDTWAVFQSGPTEQQAICVNDNGLQHEWEEAGDTETDKGNVMRLWRAEVI